MPSEIFPKGSSPLGNPEISLFHIRALKELLARPLECDGTVLQEKCVITKREGVVDILFNQKDRCL